MLVIKTLLTFSHIAIASNCAFFARGLTGSSGWKTYETNALLKVSFTVQLQKGNIIVQGLAVVVVVDVGCCYPKRLRSWRAKLLSEVMISHTDIYGISGSNNAKKNTKLVNTMEDFSHYILCNTMGCC